MKRLMTIGTFIAVAFVAPMGGLAGDEDSSQAEADRTVTIEATDSEGSLEEIAVETSTSLKIVLVNRGDTTHGLALPGLGIEGGQVEPEGRISLIVRPDLPGIYAITCNVDGHDELIAELFVVPHEGEESKTAKVRDLRISRMLSGKTKPQMGSDFVDKKVRATVTQDEGGATYWMMPSYQKLASYFGTKEDPALTANPPSDAPARIKQLFEDAPFLFGVPVDERVSKNGEVWTRNRLPYGNHGISVEGGSLEVTYYDQVDRDDDDPPVETNDGVDAHIQFTDPDGNLYEINPKLVIQPPFPGYNTQGGVMTDTIHHGASGTGSPLMPEVNTLAAFWAIGTVRINNGIHVSSRRILHCMTVKTAGTLDPYNTHCLVLPIILAGEGPKYEPVKTAIELPSGERQPFIHVVFTDDSLDEALQCFSPRVE
jgi:catechol 2,3-dioxygenase-like lactoylglutathione lyase family enzyme